MSYIGTVEVLYLSQIQDSQYIHILSAGTLNNFIQGTLIPKAEDMIDSFVAKREGTLRHFNPHSNQTITLDGTGKKMVFVPPKYAPLMGLGTITIDGVAVGTPSDIKVHDQYVEYDGGIFPEGEHNIVLIGSYGYATVPHDVQLICGQICANVLLDMVRRNVAPDVFMSLLQGSSEGGGAFRTLFAQPTVFTKDMKDQLDNYRIIWVGVG